MARGGSRLRDPCTGGLAHYGRTRPREAFGFPFEKGLNIVMTRTREIRMWLFVAATAAIAATGAEAAAQNPEPLSFVAEGSGIAFQLPAGARGRFEPAEGRFAFEAGGTQGAIWAYSSGSVDEMANVVGRELEALGLLAVEDHVGRTPDGLRGSYDVWSDAGRGRLAGEIRSGPNGAVVAVAAMGSQSEEAHLWDTVDRVVASLQWHPPLAHRWRERLAGTTLEGGSANSDFSPDAYTDTPLSQAGRNDIVLTLCRDGSYAFESESRFSVSTPEVSVSSEDNDEHVGSWSLVSDIAGNALLVLAPLDRDELAYDVAITEQGLVVGAYAYTTRPAPC